jgi:hypothetical protein
MNEQYKQAHEEARKRFLADPSKCYQRHIRELWEEIDGRHSPCSIECRKHCPHLPKSMRLVRRITVEEAAPIILKYEWLAAEPTKRSPLGRGIEACYGLFLDNELIGVNLFGSMGGQIGNICGPLYSDKTGYLMRGACVHYAPMHAASYFTQQACKLTHSEMGWSIVFAYSDTHAASEVGTVYQACGWYYLGEDLGRSKGSHHSNFLSPDGTVKVSSYQLNHDKKRKFLRSLGWTEEHALSMRAWLRDVGKWTEEKELGKKKWATFLGTEAEKRELRAACKYPLDNPYPKNRVPKEKEHTEHDTVNT